MNEILTKLLRLKPAIKIGVTAGIVVGLAAVYYLVFYSDVSSRIEAALRVQTQLKAERESYEKRRKEFIAYRDELRKLQEEQRELLKALPKKAEIATFMSSIQEQIELCGLESLSLNFGAEIPEALYVRIPVSLDIRGPYHSITRFFKNVSEMRRIVNIENLSLGPEAVGADGILRMRARFVAATFRYLDKGGG